MVVRFRLPNTHRNLVKMAMIRHIIIATALVSAIMTAYAGIAVGQDVPHNAINDIVCSSCHVIHNHQGPSLIRYDTVNNLCRSCHYEAGPAPDASTHRDQSCAVCHNPHTQEQDHAHGTTYGKLIRTEVETPGSGTKDVWFTASAGSHSFADGDVVYDGICEVCHVSTSYHRNSVEGDHTHHAGEDCTVCHTHPNGFSHGGGGGGECGDCHGHDDGWGGGTYSGSTVSHSTHTEDDSDDLRGPNIDCDVCHDAADFPYFASGTDGNGDGKYDLSETDVCDVCHSPGGMYDGLNDPAIGAKSNWEDGVYSGYDLVPGKETWCVGCHDDDPAAIDGADAPNVSLFWTAGHGRGAIQCEDCHDVSLLHIDGEARTYGFNSAYYGPSQSGVAYREGYRLSLVGGEVPLMIPANYNITFGYDAGLMRDTAFRLCFQCHDPGTIFDDTPGDGIASNFKASLPRPPRNYSYAWGSGADVNEHVSHILNYMGPFADSDWDSGTNGPGGMNGRDTMTACSSCHNVHGVAGIYGSTNEVMVRDGTLAGKAGYGFSYVIEDVGAGGYPQVTSTGATQANSVGAIFRNSTTDNMCGGSMCHGEPTPPAGSSYDASGSSWGTYLEYYRPWQSY